MSGSLLSDQNKGISAFHPEPLDRNKNKAGAQRALGADVAVFWLHRSFLVIQRHKENYGSQNPYLAVMNTTLGMVFLTAKS
jgi:hypothetical protein